VQEFTVNFKGLSKTIKAPKGSDLLAAAIRAGLILNTACGGEGLCGKCRVIVKKGNIRDERSKFINDRDRKKGFVLACQTLIEGDLEVEVPKESLEVHEKIKHESEEFTKGIILKREDGFKFSPFVRKFYVELPPPTLDDNVSDLERIGRELKGSLDKVMLSAKLANVKHLSEVIRESDFKITVVVGYRDGELEMLTVEPGDTTKANYGFAFDIGTTTVVGQLIDLNTKNILGTRIAFNRQSVYGSDVITRIIYGSEPKGLDELNEAVISNISEIIEDLVSANKVNLSDVYVISYAGNMTMMHLLLKIDPTNIRKAPYVPTTTVFPIMHSSGLGIEVSPKGISSFLPGVSTYIGGDIVGGVLACGLYENDEISLLADIGTNGEIVLGNKEWMIGAAASAGPAFEGSGLSFGMKAVRGAIEKVKIDENLNIELGTIGPDKPKGICGSGYIDLLCQMLKRGIITKDGKMNRGIKSGRVRKGAANYEFVVAFKNESSIGKDIIINEDDIENLKRSKGAIYSAIIALLNKVEKKLGDVKKIYIAGGFGNYLNIENAIFIGLLPDADRDVYEFVGNSSLAGARMALLSHEAFEKTNEIYKNITYVDLGSEPNYMDEYIAALFFPHTDLGRFPSVRL